MSRRSRERKSGVVRETAEELHSKRPFPTERLLENPVPDPKQTQPVRPTSKIKISGNTFEQLRASLPVHPEVAALDAVTCAIEASIRTRPARPITLEQLGNLVDAPVKRGLSKADADLLEALSRDCTTPQSAPEPITKPVLVSETPKTTTESDPTPWSVEEEAFFSSVPSADQLPVDTFEDLTPEENSPRNWAGFRRVLSACAAVTMAVAALFVSTLMYLSPTPEAARTIDNHQTINTSNVAIDSNDSSERPASDTPTAADSTTVAAFVFESISETPTRIHGNHRHHPHRTSRPSSNTTISPTPPVDLPAVTTSAGVAGSHMNSSAEINPAIVARLLQGPLQLESTIASNDVRVPDAVTRRLARGACLTSGTCTAIDAVHRIETLARVMPNQYLWLAARPAPGITVADQDFAEFIRNIFRAAPRDMQIDEYTREYSRAADSFRSIVLVSEFSHTVDTFHAGRLAGPESVVINTLHGLGITTDLIPPEYQATGQHPIFGRNDATVLRNFARLLRSGDLERNEELMIGVAMEGHTSELRRIEREAWVFGAYATALNSN
ncbi:hypothetical protein HY990_06040 [Candidatus Micrarchaeota archaeon]|nr:hypothetical protein [Candidatus Micrarchaeota archaeon]